MRTHQVSDRYVDTLILWVWPHKEPALTITRAQTPSPEAHAWRWRTDDAVQVGRKVGRQRHGQHAPDAVQESSHGASRAGQRDPEAEAAVRLHHRRLHLRVGANNISKTESMTACQKLQDNSS